VSLDLKPVVNNTAKLIDAIHSTTELKQKCFFYSLKENQNRTLQKQSVHVNCVVRSDSFDNLINSGR